MAQPDAGGEEAEPVGTVLGGLRRRAHLTGQQLGRMVGMSQAKISRIETGQASASPADVARLARALGAADEAVEALTAQAARDHNRMTDWRHTSAPIGGAQHEFVGIEARATVFRVFQPNLIVGLAQTTEYARAILTSLTALSGLSGAAPVTKALTARVRRQEILEAEDRQFHLLMAESALSYRFVSPSLMIAQLERLRELSRRANVQLRFLPLGTAMPLPLVHGFELLDDEWVGIDVYNTGLTSRGASDIAAYREVFDRLEAVASSDVEPILRKYRDVYLRELTRDDPDPS